MARRFGFKPTHKDILRGNDAAIKFLALSAGRDVPPELLNNVPDAKPRAAPRQLEAPVVAAISELLAVHPRVIWAARFNSGAASYEAATGRYAPVWFHKFLRSPEKMRMPDFFGIAYAKAVDKAHVDGTPFPFALEAKAPTWTRPHGDREREQAAFLEMIRKAGGTAGFARSVDEAKIILES